MPSFVSAVPRSGTRLAIVTWYALLKLGANGKLGRKLTARKMARPEKPEHFGSNGRLFRVGDLWLRIHNGVLQPSSYRNRLHLAAKRIGFSGRDRAIQRDGHGYRGHWSELERGQHCGRKFDRRHHHGEWTLHRAAGHALDVGRDRDSDTAIRAAGERRGYSEDSKRHPGEHRPNIGGGHAGRNSKLYRHRERSGRANIGRQLDGKRR